MNPIHTSYKVSKALKEFLGESAPEPMDGIYIKVGVCSNGPSYPRYALHDLLSDPFCSALSKRMLRIRPLFPEYIGRKMWEAYYLGGMEAVEKALIELMEGR